MNQAGKCSSARLAMAVVLGFVLGALLMVSYAYLVTAAYSDTAMMMLMALPFVGALLIPFEVENLAGGRFTKALGWAALLLWIVPVPLPRSFLSLLHSVVGNWVVIALWGAVLVVAWLLGWGLVSISRGVGDTAKWRMRGRIAIAVVITWFAVTEGAVRHYAATAMISDANQALQELGITYDRQSSLHASFRSALISDSDLPGSALTMDSGQSRIRCEFRAGRLSSVEADCQSRIQAVHTREEAREAVASCPLFDSHSWDNWQPDPRNRTRWRFAPGPNNRILTQRPQTNALGLRVGPCGHVALEVCCW